MIIIFDYKDNNYYKINENNNDYDGDDCNIF